MDVNGTRFKLLKGESDWQQCQEDGSVATSPWQNAAWDNNRQAVTLNPALALFRNRASTPLDLGSRRGAARDEYGNQFWISHDSQQIYWIAAADQAPALFWDQTAASASGQAGGAQFEPSRVATPVPFTLAGMALTLHHYLVVGYYSASGSSSTEKGVFLFDLRTDGPPIRLLFPAPAHFEPFDMAADASGGVWILDRTNRAYWGLDREFRLIGAVPGSAPAPSAPPAFQPVPAPINPPVLAPHPIPVAGFPITAIAPTGITTLPDGTVLILDTPPAGSPTSPTPSRLFRYHLADLIGDPIDLVVQMPVVIEGGGEQIDPQEVRGFDLAFLSGTASVASGSTGMSGSSEATVSNSSAPSSGTLYIVEQDGNQVIAFDLQIAKPLPHLLGGAPPSAPLFGFGALALTGCDAYLPLQNFGGRALIAQSADIYYDVSTLPVTDPKTRWATLQAIDDPRYTPSATLNTPIFNGYTEDCVWHRLFLEACLPATTAVEIWSRAANSVELLEATAFVPEPSLYQRGAGTELPYYNPFPGNTNPDTGTYETVFQQAVGQYLQIQLRLTGNGRLTPVLYCLRAYYPRFSYPRQYLPGIYLQDATSLAFLERFMANPEGFFSDLDGKIENVSLLFDGRSAPPETLDWLAGWLGLALDPIWQDIQQRRVQANATTCSSTCCT